MVFFLKLCGDVPEPGHCIVEELLIAFAEVAWCAVIAVDDDPVLEAAAPAHIKVPADEAFVVDLAFFRGEGAFDLVMGEFFDGRFEYVAEPPRIIDEEVAAEGVAVVLDDDIIVALGHEGADRVPSGDAVGQDAVEHPDRQFRRAKVDPAVEYSAHKVTELLRRYAEIGDLARSRVVFDAGNELEILDAKVHEEVEDIIGSDDIVLAYQHENIELDVMFFAFFDRGHHPVERPLAGVVEAIVIVVFFRSVEAYADEEFVFVQKTAPLIVIEEYAVGLEGIGDDLAVGAVLPLKLDDFFVEVQPHQSRLAALPGKAAAGQVELEVAGDHSLCNLVAHSVGTAAKDARLAGIKAVLAVDIAIGPGRFYQ